MKIRKPEFYDYDKVVRAGEIDAFAFQELKETPDGLQTVINFRAGVEKILQGFDQRWIVLCGGDIQELTEWADRMRSIHQRLNELDRHLAVKGTRAFEWDSVIIAMGYVNAQRVAIEQVLGLNEPVAA